MGTISVLLDLLFVAIVAFCVWRGYKSGIIVSVFAMVALFVALIAANITATVYHSEFDGAISTFAGGIVDTAAADTLKFQGLDEDGNPDDRYAVLTEQEKRDVYTVSFNTLKRIGVCDRLAEQLSTETAAEVNIVGQEMRTTLTGKLSEKTAFSAVFFVVFILIAIVFAAIGNIVNLSFEIPGAQKVNHAVGAGLAAVNGVVIVLFIACVLRYSGIILGRKAVDGTLIVKSLVNSNILANIFGI